MENSVVQRKELVSNLQISPKKVFGQPHGLIWSPSEDGVFSFPQNNLEAAIKLMERQIEIEKLTTGGSLNTRKFKIERVQGVATYLQWASPKKKLDISRVELAQVNSIEFGMAHPRFAKKKGKITDGERRCVTITYELNTKSLCLVFQTVELKELFVTALEHFVMLKIHSDPHSFNEKQYAAQLWYKAKHQKGVNLDSLSHLLSSQGYGFDPGYLALLFKHCAGEGNQILEYQQFLQVIETLRVQSLLKGLFNSYKDDNAQVITPAQLASFQRNIQGQIVSVEFCTRNIQKFLNKECMRITASSALGLDLYSFSQFCTSTENSISNPSVVEELTDDMNNPLPHYLINTCHLSQRQGETINTTMFRNVLLTGCRCIQLDIKQGSYGEPVVSGRQSSNSILITDVLQTIKEAAFVTSQYPVILMLEVNELSSAQQQKLAAHLTSILGQKSIHSLSKFQSSEEFASPNDLKLKFIIQAKAAVELRQVSSKSSKSKSSIKYSLGVEQEQQVPDKPRKLLSMLTCSLKFEDKQPFQLVTGQKVQIPRRISHTDPQEQQQQETLPQLKHSPTFGKETKQSLEKEHISSNSLKNLIGLRTLDYSQQQKKQKNQIYHCALHTDQELGSLQRQDKANELLKSHFSSFGRVKVDKEQMQWWNLGVQFVSIDFFNDPTDQVLRNEAIFLRNRRAGYVLKSSEIRDDSIQTNSRMLKISLLSAKQLPCDGEAFLHVTLQGNQLDQGRYTTKGAVGVSPLWRQECKFLINIPELAFLHFRVTNSSSFRSKIIAEQVVAVRNMRTGLRMVPLMSEELEPLQFSCILVFANFA